jgi:hypothetical protein
MSEPSATHCVSCGAIVFGPYCAQCGEAAGRPDYSIKHFLKELIETLTEIDGRAMWTFRALVTKPGVLARDFLAGRRNRQYGPVKLFAICNIVYFLLQPFTLFAPFTSTLRIQTTARPWREMARSLVDAKLAASGQTFEQYAVAYDQAAHLQGKSLVFLMVPLFALGTWVMYGRARRFFAEHLVASFYTYAFLLLWFGIGTLALTGVFRAGLHAGFELTGAWLEAAAAPVVIGPFVAYLLFSGRNAFAEPWPATIVKSLMLTGWAYAVLTVYRFILFFTAFYAT